MKNELRLIIEEISKTRSILDDIYSYLKDFEQKELPKLGRNRTSGLVISQILENAYTSIETLFLRISQFFENSLDNERWHSDLLDVYERLQPKVLQEIDSFSRFLKKMIDIE